VELGLPWDQRFFDPIELPGRKPLVTLRDAALYITKLPKAEHGAPEWQAAMKKVCLPTALGCHLGVGGDFGASPFWAAVRQAIRFQAHPLVNRLKLA
jgi:hypothetical protein